MTASFDELPIVGGRQLRDVDFSYSWHCQKWRQQVWVMRTISSSSKKRQLSITSIMCVSLELHYDTDGSSDSAIAQQLLSNLQKICQDSSKIATRIIQKTSRILMKCFAYFEIQFHIKITPPSELLIHFHHETSSGGCNKVSRVTARSSVYLQTRKSDFTSWKLDLDKSRARENSANTCNNNIRVFIHKRNDFLASLHTESHLVGTWSE